VRFHPVIGRSIRSIVSAAFSLTIVASVGFAADPVKPIKALLVLGGCCHDYVGQQEALSKGIAARAHVEITIAYDSDKTTSHLNPVYEKATWADGFDVIIHDECTSDVKDLALINRILEPHRQGLPAVVLHCGMHSYRSEGYPDKVTPWFEFTGLQSTGHGPQTPIEIRYTAEGNPIANDLPQWTTINEELYNNSTGKLLSSASELARGKQSYKTKKGDEVKEVTQDFAVIWTNNYRDTTRVFATTLGHNTATVADERYLDLVTRGLLWSCKKLEPAYLKTK